MAFEENLKTLSFQASGDLSTKQYYIVKLDTNAQVALCGEGDAAIGILQDTPAAIGRACCVGTDGGSKVICGGSITKGARFTTDSTGKAVAVGSGDDFSLGYVRETGASGVIVACVIQPTGFHGVAGVVP